ncbi:MAG: hypothetical protein IT262_01160 [Saprospiraceae bacterium]|nr:hypothetical protein [Saprospiraceae bacterium]
MEEFKQYLNDNADEAERRAAEQVMEGLQGLRLESKVAEVAAERAALYRRLHWRRIFTSMVALALLAGAAYLFFVKNDTPAPQQQPVEQPAKPPFPVVNQDVPSENTTEKTASDPIAQLPPDERLPNPRYPAPDASMMRGDAAAGKNQQALLDQLWYTDYPLKGLKPGNSFKTVDKNLKKRNFNAAYLELEQLEGFLTKNDTLRYLKAYCLLETGEGNEALAYLDSIQGRHSAWEPQLQWYRGLAMLLADERGKALALFKQIAKSPGHPYRRHAAKAEKLLAM